MKAIIQRVNFASLKVNERLVSEIGNGLLIYLGVGVNDEPSMISQLAKKIAGLRIFRDQNDKMNLSVVDVKGEIMLVSNFTLYADVTRGNRPNFANAMNGQDALALYNKLIEELRSYDIKVVTGEFGEHMHIDVQNDGPVNIIMEL